MSRAFILEQIRNSLSPDKARSTRQAVVSARIGEHQTGVLPKLPRTRLKRVALFEEKAKAAQASIERVAASDVRRQVANWLKAHNLPPRLRVGNDPRLAKYLSRGRLQLEIVHGASDGNDIASLSHAEFGIAETGTLALHSGPDNPATLNFLPENHIVAVREDDIVNHYEEVWAQFRERFGERQMPRTVNLITGPSRSADIEQTLILGAHGPVRLHILIVRS